MPVAGITGTLLRGLVRKTPAKQHEIQKGSMRNPYLKTLALVAAVTCLAVTEFRASAQETLLIGWTNVWAYNDTTTPTENLDGTGWQLSAYDTNSAPGWKNGPALFGNDGAGLYDG